jgi:RND family efflux transporter MFP subunit
LALLVAAVSGGSAFGAEPGANDKVVTAYTQSSERAKLAFRQMGLALEVPVKEGDRVKAGQVLIQQDDRLEKKQYESLKMQGESELKIEAQAKDLALKETELKRLTGLRTKNVVSQVELERAQLDRDLSEAQLKVAREEKEVKRLDAESMAVRLEQMKMRSPFDGEVEKIDSKVGEATDPQKPSLIVVKNDPLWIIVNLPNRVTDNLKTGDALDVRYSDKDDAAFTEKQPWMKAEVSFLSPSGDAGALKRLVRLTLPNGGGTSSGREIQIRLPERLFVSGEKTASAK